MLADEVIDNAKPLLTVSSKYSASDFLYIKRFRTLVVCFFLFLFVSSTRAIEAGRPAGRVLVVVDSFKEIGDAKDVFGTS